MSSFRNVSTRYVAVCRCYLSSAKPVVLDRAHLDEIDFVERVIASGLLDIENRDNVFMVKVSKKLHFAKSSETKHGMIKRCNLLDGHLLARRLVNGRTRHENALLAVAASLRPGELRTRQHRRPLHRRHPGYRTAR